MQIVYSSSSLGYFFVVCAQTTGVSLETES